MIEKISVRKERRVENNAFVKQRIEYTNARKQVGCIQKSFVLFTVAVTDREVRVVRYNLYSYCITCTAKTKMEYK